MPFSRRRSNCRRSSLASSDAASWARRSCESVCRRLSRDSSMFDLADLDEVERNGCFERLNGSRLHKEEELSQRRNSFDLMTAQDELDGDGDDISDVSSLTSTGRRVTLASLWTDACPKPKSNIEESPVEKKEVVQLYDPKTKSGRTRVSEHDPVHSFVPQEPSHYQTMPMQHYDHQDTQDIKSAYSSSSNSMHHIKEIINLKLELANQQAKIDALELSHRQTVRNLELENANLELELGKVREHEISLRRELNSQHQFLDDSNSEHRELETRNRDLMRENFDLRLQLNYYHQSSSLDVVSSYQCAAGCGDNDQVVKFPMKSALEENDENADRRHFCKSGNSVHGSSSTTLGTLSMEESSTDCVDSIAQKIML